MSDRQENIDSAKSPEQVIASVESSIMETAAKHGEQFLENFKKYYKDRVAADFGLAAIDRKNKGVYWKVGRGFYKLFDEDYTPSIETFPVNDEKLIGTERIWDLQINELLKNRAESGKPVVILDFGGGRGLSMIRLATKHKEDIKNGILVCVVSNLGYADDDGSGLTIADMMEVDNAKNEQKHYSESDIKFVKENQNLVKFIDALACELPIISIQTPKGSLSLDGNVDIIHESFAVKHTQAPDVALSVFGTILSDQGTFFLNAQHRTHGASGNIALSDGRILDIGNSAYEDSRDVALKVGHEILQQKYKLKSPFKTLGYKVYTKSSAPDFKKLVSKLKKTSG